MPILALTRKLITHMIMQWRSQLEPAFAPTPHFGKRILTIVSLDRRQNNSVASTRRTLPGRQQDGKVKQYKRRLNCASVKGSLMGVTLDRNWHIDKKTFSFSGL